MHEYRILLDGIVKQWILKDRILEYSIIWEKELIYFLGFGGGCVEK